MNDLKTINPEHIKEIVNGLRVGGDVSEEEIKLVQQMAENPDSSPLPQSISQEPAPSIAVQQEVLQKEDEDSLNIRSLIGKMKLPDKIKAAMLGNSTCRAMLITDTNRMIQQCVLKNPKMTEKEIEVISKNPNMTQGVLRTIAESKEWMKSYAIKLNIVTNPKTPSDLALKWLRFLNMTDLKKVSKSKNVSNVVATTATKKVSEMEQK